MKLNNFKFTFNGLVSAFVDIGFMLVRPILFLLIWNYGVAEKTNIPKLDILQVISIVIIFIILVTYVPLILQIKNNKNDK
jgi:hypothetical protein